MADAVEPAGRARVVGVLGGCGGAGASVLAAALATTAADAGHRVLLADLDPLGGGADVLVGADDLTGLRWGDLARARGRLPAASVHDLLPRLGSLAVLGFGRGAPVDLPPAAVEAVLRSASRGHDLVVLDLPRHDDLATARARALVDDLLVVVPARVRAVVATGRLLTALALTGAPGDAATPRLVVRRAPRDPLTARAVADAVGLPLVAQPARRAGARPRRRRAPGLRARSDLRRAAARCLADLPVAQPERAA
ncbi:hypothetical protein GCM10025868_18280 [Angustibacter aerolatus]|uniref:Uncharacterized protein n=1 Tax=Angustibacter aerolatus TaxID=1162965 RepID=A0ABQ6JEJ3_9ACTN|nr:septum site-determining protein Ssd [Angustibacter aerolatus]GMA86578.1 hypothetical protein GCM10025868_18280 [Angustibacter aerolatus]